MRERARIPSLTLHFCESQSDHSVDSHCFVSLTFPTEPSPGAERHAGRTSDPRTATDTLLYQCRSVPTVAKTRCYRRTHGQFLNQDGGPIYFATHPVLSPLPDSLT